MESYFEAYAANLHIMDVDQARNRFLLHVSGPRDPGGYYCYDRGAKQLQTLGLEQPAIDPKRLAPIEAVRVKTRDGAEIDAYLTTPLTKSPAPLVVLPHGGPEVRDQVKYDLWVQALAARGWWVLQPNFRGSGGYGRAFASAGWGHWGDLMQADVEDAVDQVVASHKLDPRRVAIMGGSYGGYAALMGGYPRRTNYQRRRLHRRTRQTWPEMLKYETRHGRSAAP